MDKEKGSLTITEEGIITQIIELHPELNREDIEITETELLSPEGVKIFFEVPKKRIREVSGDSSLSSP